MAHSNVLLVFVFVVFVLRVQFKRLFTPIRVSRLGSALDSHGLGNVSVGWCHDASVGWCSIHRRFEAMSESDSRVRPG